MTKRTEPERWLYTVNEFCKLTKIGRTLFYKLVRAGELPVVKIGTATRVSAHVLAHVCNADRLGLSRTAAHKKP